MQQEDLRRTIKGTLKTTDQGSASENLNAQKHSWED